VIAISCCVPMGKAWHVVVLIVGHGTSRCHRGSCGALWLTAAGTAPPAALSTLTFLREGCCHHIRSVLFFEWTLPFVVVIPPSSILDSRFL
jgi:hypothetical protein